MLRVAFQDQGQGISPGDEEKVFDRFFTRSEGVIGSPAGVGLGLAITKLIIERAGGIVRFDTNIEVGARCITVFPVVASGKPTE